MPLDLRTAKWTSVINKRLDEKMATGQVLNVYALNPSNR